MASGQESGGGSGMSLMDLITSDPVPASSGSVTSNPPPNTSYSSSMTNLTPASTLGKLPPSEKKTKRSALLKIQSETISAAKALNPVRANIMPQRQKKKVPTLVHSN